MKDAMDTLQLLIVLAYDFALICLCTYMVGWKGWSLWTYVLLLFLFIVTKNRENGNGTNS